MTHIEHAREQYEPDALGADPVEESVRRRAYELYVARGDAPGSAVDDWLAAERELRADLAAGADADGATVWMASRADRAPGADGDADGATTWMAPRADLAD